MTTSRRPQGRLEASTEIVIPSTKETSSEHLDDSGGAPDEVLINDERDDLPFAFNEAYFYGRGDDDRLVSDISERYPEASSDDIRDDQPVVEQPSIKAIIDRIAARSDADSVGAEKAQGSSPFARSRQNSPGD